MHGINTNCRAQRDLFVMGSLKFTRGGRQARLFSRKRFLACAFAALLICASCHKKNAHWMKFAVLFEATPQSPRVGPVTVTFVIQDPESKPIRGAHVNIEADMSHAGMSPVFAQAKEVEPGHYQSTLNLGMAGDWVVLLHGSLPDGEKIEEQFDLKGVQPN